MLLYIEAAVSSTFEKFKLVTNMTQIVKLSSILLHLVRKAKCELGGLHNISIDLRGLLLFKFNFKKYIMISIHF